MLSNTWAKAFAAERLSAAEHGVRLLDESDGKALPCFTLDALGRMIWDPEPEPGSYSLMARPVVPSEITDISFPWTWSYRDLVAALRRLAEEGGEVARSLVHQAYPRFRLVDQSIIWTPGKLGISRKANIIAVIKRIDAEGPDSPDGQEMLDALQSAGALPIPVGTKVLDGYHTGLPSQANGPGLKHARIEKMGWMFDDEVIRPSVISKCE